MKIQLKYPYNLDWRYGYIVTNTENRKTLILYNSHVDRSSTQYARYLLAVKLGRYLTKDETVDHHDEDKTNDDISNLKLLSNIDNIRKSSCKPPFELICPVCSVHFERTHTQLRGRLDRARNNDICCSRQCGGKKSSVV